MRLSILFLGATIVSLVLHPGNALAQRGGAGVTGGGGAGGNTTANRTEAGAVNASAGSSDQISRDFGDGLVGRGDTADRFVGNQAASAQTGQFRAPTNFQNLNRQRAQQSQPAGNPIRARIVLGFDNSLVAAQPSLLLADRSASQFALSSVRSGLSYTISDAGVATVSGRVETSRERRLAESIVRLEPGVRRVDNKIEIAPVTPPLP